MPLQSSGQIKLSQLASEFGGSTPHSLSEYYNRGNVTSSGQIGIGEFYGQGAGTTATLSTNSGTMTRYEGVSEDFGNGEYAVVTGATNPTITWSTTYSGTTQGMAIACCVFGY